MNAAKKKKKKDQDKGEAGVRSWFSRQGELSISDVSCVKIYKCLCFCGTLDSGEKPSQLN